MGSRKAEAYQEAGVDVEAGEAFARALAPLAARTRRKGSLGEIGGFGGFFDIAALNYSDPVLVAASDGVGTKTLLLEDDAGWHIAGMDLVAMCVNDLVAQGAEPLFFLDYLAVGQLDQAQAIALLEGVADACREARCALIGGETAEMPGLYQGKTYDLAGFAVGAVERDKILPSPKTKEGDKILGLASNGIHSNGFSLVRHILQKKALLLKAPFPQNKSQSTRAALLNPTRLYVRPLLSLLRSDAGKYVRGIAHITGGGITGNLPRALGKAEDCAVEIDAASLPMGDAFSWLQEAGALSDADMLGTFNCGIGMALLIEESAEEEIRALLEDKGEKVIEIGRVLKREKGGAKITIQGALL